MTIDNATKRLRDLQVIGEDALQQENGEVALIMIDRADLEALGTAEEILRAIRPISNHYTEEAEE